jgi:hypothetical protein
MTASPRGSNCGRDFAEALARKDFAGIKDLLRPDIDFPTFAVATPGGRFMMEQQAYYAEQDGQIAWMRVMCSGFRSTGDAAE